MPKGIFIRKKHTEKSKQKMSNSRLKGIKEGKITTWNKDKCLTEEHIKKAVETRKKRGSYTSSWNKGMKIRQGEYHYKTGKHLRISHIEWCKSNKLDRIPEGCVIHHINGDVENNKPDNLQLMTRGSHSSLHNKFNKLNCACKVL